MESGDKSPGNSDININDNNYLHLFQGKKILISGISKRIGVLVKACFKFSNAI
jgi:hypothetical protein